VILCRGAVRLITAAITGLGRVVLAAAAAASSGPGGITPAAAGCFSVSTAIPVGFVAQSVAADPATDVIYVASQTYDLNQGTVSVINGQSNEVTATITVGSLPVSIAADPATDAIYVAEYGAVAVINGRTNKVEDTMSLGVKYTPSPISASASATTARPSPRAFAADGVLEPIDIVSDAVEGVAGTLRQELGNDADEISSHRSRAPDTECLAIQMLQYHLGTRTNANEFA
jgi:YVTN family beta-propeller protein